MAPPAFMFNYGLEQEQVYKSQEARLNYNTDKLTWFVGASMYHEELTAHYDQDMDEDTMCATTAVAYYGYTDMGITDCASLYEYWGYDSYGTGGYLNETTDIDAEYEGWGVYTDGTYDVTDKLSISAGARYTEDTRDFTTIAGRDDTANYEFWFSFPLIGTASDEKTWTNLSARIAANYNINDDISVFANYGTGYKAGGFNTFDADWDNEAVWEEEDGGLVYLDEETGVVPTPFDEETVTNFEVGIKSMWWDNRIQLDASAYTYQFEGMQTVYYDGALPKLANSGDAEGSGLEVSTRILPTENLDIYWGLAWADTELTDPNPTFCDSAGCVKGATLPGTIGFSSSLVATYTTSLGDGDAYATIEHFYNEGGPGFGHFADESEFYSDDFNELNLRLGYRSSAGWNASVWVSNLTDEYKHDSPVGHEYNLPAHYIGFTEPRRIGMTFGYDF